MSNLPGSEGSGFSDGAEGGPTDGSLEVSQEAGSSPPIEENGDPSGQSGIKTSEWHPELGFASLEDETEFFNSPYVQQKLQETGRLKARNYGNMAATAAQRQRALSAQRSEAELEIARMPAAERQNLSNQVTKPIAQDVAQRLLGVIRDDPAVQNADPDDFPYLDPIFYADDPRKGILAYGAFMRRVGERSVLEGRSTDAKRRDAFEQRRKGNQAKAEEVARKTPQSSGRTAPRGAAAAGQKKYASAADVTKAWKAGEIDEVEGSALMEQFRYG